MLPDLFNQGAIFSGFDGENGWVRDNTILDNDYYIELVGGSSGSSVEDSTIEDLVDGAPPWVRVFENNQDLEGIPNRRAWVAFPPSDDFPDGERIIMLNADVS